MAERVLSWQNTHAVLHFGACGMWRNPADMVKNRRIGGFLEKNAKRILQIWKKNRNFAPDFDIHGLNLPDILC